jgi:hypothetical protein
MSSSSDSEFEGLYVTWDKAMKANIGFRFKLPRVSQDCEADAVPQELRGVDSGDGREEGLRWGLGWLLSMGK